MSTISPELALVDPELAAAARVLLHEPGRFRPAWDPRAFAGAENLASAAPSKARRPDIRGHFGRRGALAIAVIVAGVVTTVALEQSLPGRSATAPPAPAAEGRSAVAAQAAQQNVAARTYTWPAVPGAEVYEIRLVRGGQLVYQATSRAPAVLLPAGLVLRPGRYTLSATPRSDGSASDPTGRPVVEETFVVAPL